MGNPRTARIRTVTYGQVKIELTCGHVLVRDRDQLEELRKREEIVCYECNRDPSIKSW